MMLSLISESIFSTFMVCNIVILVPKFSLFVFDMFLTFKYMPLAMKINVGKEAVTEKTTEGEGAEEKVTANQSLKEQSVLTTPPTHTGIQSYIK